MPELLPCPFCGEMSILNVKDGLYQIKCDNCGCWIGPQTSYYTEQETAIEAWNTRTPKERGVDNG